VCPEEPLSILGRTQQVSGFHQVAQLIRGDQHDILGTAAVNDDFACMVELPEAVPVLSGGKARPTESHRRSILDTTTGAKVQPEASN
jgi:hypothetical protein